MTLKAIIDATEREGLHEVLQAEYIPLEGHDGYFIQDHEAVELEGQRFALENVTGLRTSLEKTRNERDKAKELARRFDGVDPAEYQRLMSRKTEIESWDPTNDDAFKTRLEEANSSWETKYNSDVEKEKERANAAEAKYQNSIMSLAATDAINKVAPGKARVLLPHILPLLGVYGTEDPNRDAVYVRGDGDKPKITQKAGDTGNMTALELVERMKDDPDFMEFFPGTGASGGGAAGGGQDAGGRRAGASSAEDESGLSGAERLKRARARQKAR